jgi:hypothetical protein
VTSPRRTVFKKKELNSLRAPVEAELKRACSHDRCFFVSIHQSHQQAKQVHLATTDTTQETKEIESITLTLDRFAAKQQHIIVYR